MEEVQDGRRQRHEGGAVVEEQEGGRDMTLLSIVGAEMMAIVIPVSICMLLVVLLVHSLTPHGADGSIQSVATLVYMEKPTDSSSQKLEGALLNSLVFVATITVVTFLLVLLYYYRCIRFLKYYMCASAALVLAYMGGAVFFQLINTWSIPLDIVSFSLFLFNFTVVGVLSVFMNGMPIVVTQFYLVMIGMLVAFWFTMLPEWTTWMLLVAMALYDLVAVLAPGGPLKLLVELAMSRDEEIPALIYEARPTSVPKHSYILPQNSGSSSSAGASASNGSRSRRWRNSRRSPVVEENAVRSTELQPRGASTSHRHPNGVAIGQQGPSYPSSSGVSAHVNPAVDSQSSSETPSLGGHDEPNGREDDEAQPLINDAASSLSTIFAADRLQSTEILRQNSEADGLENESEDGIGLSASGAIKLGLGDFVFYSLLVGRAAMYDLMTVYACYLAIIAGLGFTLILLAVARKALPALPISICLGVVFYFLSRLLMEPLIVGLSTTVLMF